MRTCSVSRFALPFFAVCLLALPQFALAQGPAQPEAMQFEPVDVTDVVNLATGDFAYTLPLLSVPGPEGDYPIAMSYHSGIGPNQEATWVGLGWTLNAGAVNRSVTGYPDDYRGAQVETRYYSPEQISKTYTLGIAFNLGIGTVGVNMAYNNHMGMLGPNMNIGLAIPITENSPFTLKAGLSGGSSGFSGKIGGKYGTESFGIGGGVNYGSRGLSGSMSARYQDASASVSVGKGSFRASAGAAIGKSTVGFSLSSHGAGASFSRDVGAEGGMSVAGEGTVSKDGFDLSLPPLGPLNINLGYSEHSWKLDELHEEEAFGYIHQEAYRVEGDPDKRKFERHVQGQYFYPSQDHYNVSAQGLSGAFSPFYPHAYAMIDADWDSEEGIESEERAKLENDCGTAAPIFRFLGDQGSNLVSAPSSGTPSYCDDYASYLQLNEATSHYGSKTIEPVFPSADSGHIGGFIVTDSDGKKYEFLRPVFNFSSYTLTLNYENASSNNGKPDSSWTRMGTPYATQWLLTGIKGPDYVDRAPEGFGDEDWGYWVALHYDAEMPQVWRSPNAGFTFSPMSREIKSYSIGLRETHILKKIETATHQAEFIVANSPDRSVPASRTGLVMEQAEVYDAGVLGMRFLFKGNLIPFLKRHDSLYTHDVQYQQNPDQILTATKEECKWTGFGMYCAELPIYYHIDELSSWTYDAIGQQTVIYVPRDTQIWGEYKFGRFTSELIPSGTYASGKKLTSIQLTSKVDSSSIIKSAAFTYNYSLRPGSDGSSAVNGAVLTLQEVEMQGQNGARASPPYRFYYTAQIDGFNPSWKRDYWDNWGSYRAANTIGGDADSTKHITPQEDYRAEQAIAWELRSISTPTGAVVFVEYERDDYYYLNNSTYDLSHVYDLESGDVPDVIESLWSSSEKISKSTNGECVVENASFAGQLYNGDVILIVGYYEEDLGDDVYRRSYGTQVARVESVSGNSIWLDFDDYCLQGETVFDAGLIALERRVFGGNSRVKSIRTSIGYKTYETTYTYQDEYGRSSGVTASLPGAYGNDLEELYKEDFLSGVGALNWYHVDSDFASSFSQHRFGYGRPAPSVLYSRVEVKSTGLMGQGRGGKTVYEFYTAKDFPYQPDSTFRSFVFNDPSGIYGTTKRTTYWEQLSDSTYRLQKIDEPQYAFSAGVSEADSLAEYGRIYEPDNTWNMASGAALFRPLGLIQEVYLFCNEDIDENSDCSSQQGIHQFSGERRYQNVFPVRSVTTEYLYAGGSQVDSIVTVSQTFGWDARSGKAVLVGTLTGSEEAMRITRTTPAYWLYDGMRDKNMLTQIYEQAEFLVEALDFGGLASFGMPQHPGVGELSYGYPSTYYQAYQGKEPIASTVTTWGDWATTGDTNVTGEDVHLWRQNDSYSYIRSRPYLPFDITDWGQGADADTAHTYPVPGADYPWQMTSNITAYDRFSRIRETVGADGSYATTIYGYDEEALVTAVVANARQDEVVYESFEDQPSSSVYTGQGSLGSSATTINNWFQDKVPDQTPAQGGSYIVEMWAKPPSGGPMRMYDDGAEVYLTATSGWQLIRLVVGAGSTITTSSGGGWIDDVRIYPERARMSSFVYDPVTWKVVAMTDANSRSTFFEYDAAGRLVAVRDQEKKLVSTHSYRYGRNSSP